MSGHLCTHLCNLLEDDGILAKSGVSVQLLSTMSTQVSTGLQLLALGMQMLEVSHMQPSGANTMFNGRQSSRDRPYGGLNTILEAPMPPSGWLHAHGVRKALNGAVFAAAGGLLDEAQKLQLPTRAAEAYCQVLQRCFVCLHGVSQHFQTRLWYPHKNLRAKPKA